MKFYTSTFTNNFITKYFLFKFTTYVRPLFQNTNAYI